MVLTGTVLLSRWDATTLAVSVGSGAAFRTSRRLRLMGTARSFRIGSRETPGHNQKRERRPTPYVQRHDTASFSGRQRYYDRPSAPARLIAWNGRSLRGPPRQLRRLLDIGVIKRVTGGARASHRFSHRSGPTVSLSFPQRDLPVVIRPASASNGISPARPASRRASPGRPAAPRGRAATSMLTGSDPPRRGLSPPPGRT